MEKNVALKKKILPLFAFLLSSVESQKGIITIQQCSFENIEFVHQKHPSGSQQNIVE